MLKAGSAIKKINCRIGDGLAGQLHNRVCVDIRDDLEANILYMENGPDKTLFISSDETLRLLDLIQYNNNPEIKVVSSTLDVDIRFPDEKELEEAARIVAAGEGETERGRFVLEHAKIRLFETFKNSPVESLKLQVVRIGDYIAAFMPGEVFCQFGIDIRRRSPKRVAAVVELTGTYCCYIPTIAAVMGGGYSAAPMFWCRLEQLAGYKIVEEISRLMNIACKDSDDKDF